MNQHDVNEIDQLKKIIAEQNQKITHLEQVIDQIPCNVYWKDRNGYYLGCNSSNLRIVTVESLEDFIGKTAHELLPKKFADAIQKVDEQVMSSGKGLILEEQCNASEDQTFTFLSHKIPLFDENHNVIGMLGVSFDITERKKLELELFETKVLLEEQNRISNIYLSNLVENLPENFYWMDKDGRILTANENQAKVFGLSKNNLIGKNIYNIAEILGWDPSIPDAIRQNDLEVMSTKQVKKSEEIVILNGEKKTFLAYKYPLIDDQGNAIGVFGVGFDITDRKRIEEELLIAKETAESANYAKSQFITNMSHDIRTPFSGILGFSKILQKKETDLSKKEMLSYITQSSERLLNLLNEILELAKNNQNIPALPFKFNLRQSVDQIAGIMLAEIKYKNLDLKIHFDESIPLLLVGDKLKLDRILLNLLSNAIKFTRQGYIAITVQILSQTDQDIFLQIKVEDTGIGIPEDKYQTIFEYFSRLVPAYSANYQGYGLGLYMVKQYINEMGGVISVTSQVGKGSIFTFSLPFKLGGMELQTKIGIKNFELEKSIIKIQKKYILLVEDDMIAQKMAKYMLEEEFGFIVEIASTGKQALSMLKKKQYQLILTDIGLPDMDGFTLAKEIRATANFDKLPIIFGLTAHVDDASLTSEQRGNFDALLNKPLSEEICHQIFSAIETKRNII